MNLALASAAEAGNASSAKINPERYVVGVMANLIDCRW